MCGSRCRRRRRRAKTPQDRRGASGDACRGLGTHRSPGLFSWSRRADGDQSDAAEPTGRPWRRSTRRGSPPGTRPSRPRLPAWEAWEPATSPSPARRREGRRGVGWAALTPTSRRPCYAGVVEESVYVAEGARGQGVGTALLAASIESSERSWHLDDPDVDLPGERARASRCTGARLPRRRRAGADRAARRRWRDTVLMERRSEVVSMDQGRSGRHPRARRDRDRRRRGADRATSA